METVDLQVRPLNGPERYHLVRMWRQIGVFLESIKFSHTVFALPFALLSMALAATRNGSWRWADGFGIVACMVFARTAAMGFNRWADRDLDALNPRTKGRAIPAGLLRPKTVMAIVVVSAVGFVAACSVFWFANGNAWPLLLSPAVMAFLFGYSYAKRFTALAHVWLGMALALAPIAAWIAVRATVEPPPCWLALSIVCWVTGFDIIYACQDIDVDRALCLQSIPSRLGFAGAMWVARAAHVSTVAALVAFAWATPELGAVFHIAIGGVAALLFVEHWLVRGRDLQQINLAFLHVNGMISMGLLAATLTDLWLRR